MIRSESSKAEIKLTKSNSRVWIGSASLTRKLIRHGLSLPIKFSFSGLYFIFCSLFQLDSPLPGEQVRDSNKQWPTALQEEEIIHLGPSTNAAEQLRHQKQQAFTQQVTVTACFSFFSSFWGTHTGCLHHFFNCHLLFSNFFLFF